MLERLEENERDAFLSLLLYVVKTEGAVDPDWLLEEYTYMLDAEDMEISESKTPEELAAEFKTPMSRVIVLQELLRVCHLDGDFSPIEQSVILDLAAMMGVPMDLLRKIEAWVVEGIRWMLAGEALLEEADAVVINRSGK